jgi:hypothetical protein
MARTDPAPAATAGLPPSSEQILAWLRAQLPPEVLRVLESSPGYTIASTTDALLEAALGGVDVGRYVVSYDIPNCGTVVEAVVSRVRNGVAVNYPESYMRRRDPDCLVVADELPSDKPRFTDRYGYAFSELREETFAWLSAQRLSVFFFRAGLDTGGMQVMAVAPANAAFFALALGLLQGVLSPEELRGGFRPQAVIYVAPPFRHTHFKGKQVVVHNRAEGLYEMFSYNLYPGPSAKKGVYGMLLGLGEQEEWITIHSSVVRVVTPYDNRITFAHEGASGGGKSEMLEHIHREWDGRLLLGRNTLTGEERFLVLPRACELHPVADDMALCHPSLQRADGRLWATDAEKAWFIRLNHIRRYGVDPILEECTIHSPKPLMFLNVDAAPGSTALIWEHVQDAPGVPCPNPRVILPREVMPRVVDAPVSIDIRSFGVRTPPCSSERPTYGIIGLFHLLPPALAWLWRLVAPRGYANPSITDTDEMSSEGVGSYWPFATGQRIQHANLILKQILDTPRSRYILCPNQHVGAWYVGFMPQWIAREYLARRGEARFHAEQIQPARCSLLGFALNTIMVEGLTIGSWFLRVETQPEVGTKGYDRGTRILEDFFRRELTSYLGDGLMPLGRKIIECCLERGGVEDYEKFFPNAQSYVEE